MGWNLATDKAFREKAEYGYSKKRNTVNRKIKGTKFVNCLKDRIPINIMCKRNTAF